MTILALLVIGVLLMLLIPLSITLTNRIYGKVRHLPRSLRDADGKWFIITLLIMWNVRIEITFFALFLAGMGVAPLGNPTVEHPERFIEAGHELGRAFIEAMITVVDAGYKLGWSLYPWNQAISSGITYSLLLTSVVWIMWIIGAAIMKMLPERWIPADPEKITED